MLHLEVISNDVEVVIVIVIRFEQTINFEDPASNWQIIIPTQLAVILDALLDC